MVLLLQKHFQTNKSNFDEPSKLFSMLFGIIIISIATPSLLFGQVQIDPYHDQDEIPEEVVLERRNQLIEAGYLMVPDHQSLTFSTGAKSTFEYAYYTNNYFQSATMSTRGTEFSPNGSRMYVVGRSSENVIEYHLSTPWDITTAVYSRELDTSDIMVSQTQPFNNSHGIYIRQSDGLKMYIVNRTEIWEYTLATAWNISTASPTGYKDLTQWHLRAHGVEFKPDGSVMFMEDRFLAVVFQYNLSTPWDIETASLDYTYNVPVQQDLQGIQLNLNGTRMYLIDNGLREIHEITISTPFDLRSASYLSSFSLSDTPKGIYLKFKHDFKHFYVSDPSTNRIHDYEILTPPNPQLSTISALTSKVQANNLNASTVRVVARDDNGDPIQNLPTRLVSKSGRLDYSPFTVNTNSNGEAFFEVKNNRVETVVYSARALGVELQNTTSVNFIGIDPDRSTITVDAKRIQANKNQNSIINIIARDEESNPFRNVDMELYAENGNATIETIQSKTDSNGEAIFRVSSQAPGNTNFRARGFGVTLSDIANVHFMGVDPDYSSINQTEDWIQANGEEQAEIYVHVRDEDDFPFSNLQMELLPESGSSMIEAVQPVTDSDGIAIFKVSNENIESIEYSARGLGTTINGSVTIHFIPVAPVALAASEVSTRSFTANWEVVDGAVEYFFDLSTDSTFSTFVSGYEKMEAGLTTSINIESVQPGTAYYYRVRAGKEGLIGANSETIQVFTFPDTPVASSATNRNATNFTANWAMAEGAQHYRLDVALDPDFQQILPDYDNLNTGITTQQELSNLDIGTTYYYRVRAVAGPRLSPYSNTVQTSTLDISKELSVIEKEQLRILANGIQTNTITIRLRSDEGVLLTGVETSLSAGNGQVSIDAVKSVTDDDGEAMFELSGIESGIITFTATAKNREIGTFDVEFLQDLGQLALGNNYPNPFQKNSIIPITIPETMHVEIRVYDRLGRQVQTVVNEQMAPGYYEIPFQAHGLASGTYFYRLITPNKTLTENMVLIR